MKKKNICIVVSTLGLGGAEKVAALQSKMFKELGHNVYILSISNFNYEAFDFHGEIGVLEEVGFDDFVVMRVIKRLFFLKKYSKERKLDLIIDHRSRMNLLREVLLSSFFYKVKTFFMIHSLDMIRDSIYEYPFVRSKFVFKKLYKRASFLVCVSKSIESKIRQIHKLNNLTTINNTFNEDELLEDEELNYGSYILFFGRFEELTKNLSFLIEAYSNSCLSSKGIKLLLLGEGPDKESYEKLISNFKLKDTVRFVDRKANPFSIVRAAKFTVLTSHYEGFPMSIVESLACGTPVVTVDCETGPREIIKDRYNGLLVEKSIVNFTEALNLMVLDTELYQSCKSNCLKSIEHLSYSAIKKEWEELIE